MKTTRLQLYNSIMGTCTTLGSDDESMFTEQTRQVVKKLP